MNRCPKCGKKLIIKDFEDYQLGKWTCPKCDKVRKVE